MRQCWLSGLAAGVLLGLTACGDTGGGTNRNDAECAEGYESWGPACVPIFDDCPGATEISVLGGGCQAVGVTHCATGLFEPDGAGGCEPILPDHSCPPGTMEQLGRTECRPVGVTACAAGFELDGEGGCDAVLPPGPDPCPPGTIALLGHTECQPLGDCGTGTWGNIVDDGATVYVDQTADATGADGSLSAPFVTIGEALVAVQTGGQLAVAAGDYTERLTISRAVRLTGRCSALVTIRGHVFLGDPKPPVTIASGGTGTAVRGVTMTGPGEGLLIMGGQQLAVEEVEVVDTGKAGVFCVAEAEVHLGRVKVAGCATSGIVSVESRVELSDSVVRDSRIEQSSGLRGFGIDAQCNLSPSTCGEVSIANSLISGNTDLGISSVGVDVTITASVVRDTASRSGGLFGRGILAQCDSLLAVCPTLQVTDSLIAANHDVGIFTSGGTTTITSTVIRDTLPRGSGEGGRGLGAQCDPFVGSCGGVTIVSSLIAGNRGLGVHTAGEELTVIDSVVRDTRSWEDGSFGRGIGAECNNTLGICGGLSITNSLIAGNRDLGIFAEGVAVTLTSSVVRDTEPALLDGALGRGIAVQCDADFQTCGSLDVVSSLISGNADLGLHVLGAEVVVTDSVIRDTVPAPLDGQVGRGINVQCSSDVGVCGNLSVTGSLISGNRGGGVVALGPDATVTNTVVRDNLPSDVGGVAGRGISAACSRSTGVCGELVVTDSLIAGNRETGIITLGVDATVNSTVVSGTRAMESDDTGGWGISAQCYPDLGVCGSLSLTRSLVAGNLDLGIFSEGVVATLTDTVVRDTFPRQSDGGGGRGINAQCQPELGLCGSLSVSRSLVRNSRNAGIYISSVPATLEGVAVADTRPDESGFWKDQFGQGIWALCIGDYDACAPLNMISCLVDASYNAGVALRGVSGSMHTSLVRQVAPQADGKYGYGVQVSDREGEPSPELPTFNINDCVIRDATLAGILYFRSRGTLARSIVSGAENSVVMNEGSEPTILEDNELSGTVKDDPTWANLYPTPAPPPALPKEPEQ
ncbi:MAG: right-handed parallel beta-helix repeat-containing protein [bacterium]